MITCPIGNLTSQFFANVLLDQIDHFVKEELRAPGYVRYADDLLLFADSKAQLRDYQAGLAERLAALRLRLHRGKTQVRPCRYGVKFLGLVLNRDAVRLQQGAIRRFNRRQRRLRWRRSIGVARPGDVGRSLRAWLAFAREANSAGLRQSLWRRLHWTPCRKMTRGLMP